ncbi:MAG: carboxymuconolactone decarboxylase family protein [Brachybacterium sp.]
MDDAFEAFSKAVFEEGALPGKTKQLIAVAVAHEPMRTPRSPWTRWPGTSTRSDLDSGYRR